MSDEKVHPASNGRPPDPLRDDEILLIDLILILVRGLRIIGIAIAIFAVVGLVVAASLSAEYSAEARVLPEAEDGQMQSGGLSVLQRFGIDVGIRGSQLGAASYPEIMESREVRLAVVRDTFDIARLDTSYTLVDYVNRPESFIARVFAQVQRYTIGLPATIMSFFEEDVPSRSSGSDSRAERPESPKGAVMGEEASRVYPTVEEERAMGVVQGMVVFQSTGSQLMSMMATTEDPQLSAQLVESFVKRLTERIRFIRTQKARENLEFVERQFQQAEQELEQAEVRLAQFLDRNNNLQSARLRTERDRLQRQVLLKEELYRNLQTQLTQARLELQRVEPVITVVEQPIPPRRPSGPNRVLILFTFVLLGAVGGIGYCLIRAFVSDQVTSDDTTRAKLQEIKESIVPHALIRRLSRLTEERTTEERTGESQEEKKS